MISINPPTKYSNRAKISNKTKLSSKPSNSSDKKSKSNQERSTVSKTISISQTSRTGKANKHYKQLYQVISSSNQKYARLILKIKILRKKLCFWKILLKVKIIIRIRLILRSRRYFKWKIIRILWSRRGQNYSKCRWMKRWLSRQRLAIWTLK